MHEQNFILPLGLTRTTYCSPSSPSGYARNGSTISPVQHADMSLLFAARWNRALVTGRAVSPLSYAKMSKAYRVSSGLSTSYGYALIIDTLDGHKRIWHDGAAEFKRSIQLKPNYAPAHLWFSAVLHDLRRFDEAMAEIRKAQTLDPLSLIINTNVGIDLNYLGRRAEAIEELRRTIELDPSFGFAHQILGMVYLESGNSEGAIRELEIAVKLTGQSGESLSRLGYAYAKCGRTADALKILDELKKKLQEKKTSPYRVGYVYAGLGDRAEAYRWFEQALRERDTFLIFLNSNSEFDSWRSDPEAQRLLKGMGLPPSAQ